MNRLLKGTRAFLEEEEGGQALLLILCFLVPMVLAFGMVVRTDHQIVGKMRLQTAADAAALAAGNMYARTMNQVAINNLQQVKIASLQTAICASFFGEVAVYYRLFLAEAVEWTKGKLKDKKAIGPGDPGPIGAPTQADRDAEEIEQSCRESGTDPSKSPNARSPLKGRNWGEFGKTLNAFKCWKNVFKISWKACEIAIKVFVATIKTVIGPILSALVAAVACPIAGIALLCMVCELVMMGQYILIAQWWAVETAEVAWHGGATTIRGTQVIRQLARQNDELVRKLPEKMEEEMTRVARMHKMENAFLASPGDFRTKVRLDTSKVLKRGDLSSLDGLALYGYNGASNYVDSKFPFIGDTWRFMALGATQNLNVPLIGDILGAGAKWVIGKPGAAANREHFVKKMGKKVAELDWNVGMFYFEGPAPDIHEVKFPWSDLFKISPWGKRAKELLEGNGTFKARSFSPFEFVLQIIEVARTTSKIISTKTYIPRGPVYWYLNWIQDVHFGLANYFTDKDSLDHGHTPLGNPDTIWPTCYNYIHMGCDGNRTMLRILDIFAGSGFNADSWAAKLIAKIRTLAGGRIGRILDWINTNIFERLRSFKKWLNCRLGGAFGACQFLPCNSDWTTYSADFAKMWSDFAATFVVAARFSWGSGLIDRNVVYFLPEQGPLVDYTVVAEKSNRDGFFAQLFRSRGAMNDEKMWAATRFRLYNPAEVHGDINYVEPDDNGIARSYPENLMSQDWRVKLIPVRERDLRGPPPAYPTVFRRVRH